MVPSFPLSLFDNSTFRPPGTPLKKPFYCGFRRIGISGQRYYDPDTGRFINQDSYLGKSDTPPSLHRYLYAYSNPTVYIDPDGHDVWKVMNGIVDVGGKIWKDTKTALSEARKALPVISREVNKVPAAVANSFTPKTGAGQLLATGLYTAGEFVTSNVLAPITAAGSVEEASENPTKLNIGLAVLAINPYTPKGSGKIVKKWLGKEVAVGEKLLTKEVRTGANVLETEAADAANVGRPRLKPIDSSRPTHGTTAHDATGYNQAKDWAGASDTLEARYNQQLVDQNGKLSNLTPDAQRIRTDGKIDILEVKSPSQNDGFMDSKLDKYRDILGDKAGDIRWDDPSLVTRK